MKVNHKITFINKITLETISVNRVETIVCKDCD